MADLGIIVLNGKRFVRPMGELGTCGWSPKAWTITEVRGDAKTSFLAGNKAWSEDDIGQVRKDQW